jgi:hypothetical protein
MAVSPFDRRKDATNEQRNPHLYGLAILPLVFIRPRIT